MCRILVYYTLVIYIAHFTIINVYLAMRIRQRCDSVTIYVY